MSIDFLSLLRDPNAKYFVVPVVTAFLSIVAKMMSANDKFSKARMLEYFYLAPNLLVSNFIYICCEFSRYKDIAPEMQSKLSDACVNAMIFNFWSTVGICMFIRFFGWDKDKKRLGSWFGIWIPDAAALFVMSLVFSTLSI